MREIVSTITTKGQVTVPVEIRRLLGVASHDKIAFLVEQDQVRLAARGSIVERTAGVLKSRKPPLTAEKLRVAAEQAIAEEAVERTGGYCPVKHEWIGAALARLARQVCRAP